VTPFEVRFTKEARKDIKRLSPRLKDKLKEIITHQIAVDPGGGKKLVGDLQGFYSVRLTYQDRIVYSVDRKKRIVFVHRARTHYDE
jgi:mRNA-degrading endonuclease RelE of RelBE toxin-antitoxin system